MPQPGKSLTLVLCRTAALCAIAICAAYAQEKNSADKPHRADETNAARISVVESSEKLHESLQEKPPLQFGSSRAAAPTISVGDTQFQQIDGFGASLTDSSAWLLAKKLTAPQRRQLLEMLFDPQKGIGLSILRQPMGSSDFAVGEDYSYDDLGAGETDADMKRMSVDRDRAYIIPMLREILAVNPEIKVIGSPWSPPGWMKTSHSMIGGTLSPSSYAPLAAYFVQFVKLYEAAGVPIFAVTPENEPLNIPADYPGMGMKAEEQEVFVRDNLGPAFRAAKLKTKILIFDHNWDLIAFPDTVLKDSQAAEFVAGTATHCYGGDPAAQSGLHDRFPDKGIWLTECSGGNWQKGDLLVGQANLIIQTTRNWGKSVVLWNLALDQNHGPHLGGCSDCRGVVTIDDSASPASFAPTVDFTALAHVSKFARPGAYRIASSAEGEPGIEHVAFRNDDGSVVLLALNSGAAPVRFNIEWKGQFAAYTLDSGAVATFSWSPKSTKRD
jgi:O-glycosyl hydrolase